MNQVSQLYFSCLFIYRENKGKNISLDLTMLLLFLNGILFKEFLDLKNSWQNKRKGLTTFNWTIKWRKGKEKALMGLEIISKPQVHGTNQ